MRCLLVDDHGIFREALALLVSLRHPQATLVQAGTLAAARAHFASGEGPELVLLDLALPDSQGLATLAVMREAAPTSRLVVLSADDRLETVLAAIEQGAAGFIPKTADTVLLEQALAVVMQRGVFMPPAALLHTGNGSGKLADAPPPALTPRQTAVLRMLVEGQSNKLIGRALGLSPSTVRTHVEALFERLDVHNRTQAVVAAARLGLRL
ncbi:MAG: response regulator transcription factor [Rubrivivax sp.]